MFSSLLGVANSQIYIPTELNEKRYDISADIPNDKKRNLGRLLVSALAISLNLKVKHETREVEVFVLTTPKELNGSLQPTTSKTYHSGVAKGVLAAVSADIKLLIRDLQNLLEAPIVNKTNLAGKYDWDLVFEDANTSLIDAVHNQLGLVLTRTKRPVEVVVIETEDK